jgi:hypothetical protein
MRTGAVFAIVGALVLVGGAALFILADWYGVFGLREQQRSDFMHMTFAMVDTTTGAPISGVHITCVRRTNRSACTEQTGRKPGETRITLGVLRRIDKTLLFSHDRGFSLGSDGPVTLAFIHPNYRLHSFQMREEDIAGGQSALRVVGLDRTAN